MLRPKPLAADILTHKGESALLRKLNKFSQARLAFLPRMRSASAGAYNFTFTSRVNLF
jgi:hypothetical protein